MGKRKIILGVVAGAVAGGAVALLDKEARSYACKKVKDVKSASSYYISNPSEAIQGLQSTVDKVNQVFESGSANAMNALEQVEQTLDKVTNKFSGKEIE
ncbi:YtxH domain-containing protein [Oceanobacillus sp. CFH 90083]|uniref:YtxH domain-containing protein n=1 Tax=Oceanobacillus sp. CFH 90083 TaxID=2592336 RepID=UPI00128AFD13|nr:YtxH domain-containing protein [Oceanobacillus sp. CFH 90083]